MREIPIRRLKVLASILLPLMRIFFLTQAKQSEGRRRRRSENISNIRGEIVQTCLLQFVAVSSSKYVLPSEILFNFVSFVQPANQRSRQNPKNLNEMSSNELVKT